MPVATSSHQSADTAINGVENAASSRRLILCFDGTADLFDDTNTNVVRLVSYLKKGNLEKQQVYYQSGVGTYITPGYMMPLMVKALQILDEGFAWDISNHIIGGYNFLMQNWQPDDKISIFGFSRGAYTARALAGMLHKVGLLSRGNEEQIPFAFKMYANQDATGWDMSSAFKRTFCSDIYVDILGVWDTVASVGMFTTKDLPFSASNNHTRVFRHAISLDERRCKFKANLWQGSFTPPGTVGGPSTKTSTLPLHTAGGASTSLAGAQDDTACADKTHHPVTDVEEVWFAGGHGDVGGGNVKDNVASSTNRVTLVWMIREIICADPGIEFDTTLMANDGILPPDPDADVPAIRDAAGNIQTPRVIAPQNYISRLDQRYDLDAVAWISDQLKLKWAWWILEILPFTYCIPTDQGGPNHWKLSPWPNYGRPRATPAGYMKVHVSVRKRMEEKKGYVPKVKEDWKTQKNIDWVE